MNEYDSKSGGNKFKDKTKPFTMLEDLKIIYFVTSNISLGFNYLLLFLFI